MLTRVSLAHRAPGSPSADPSAATDTPGDAPGDLYQAGALLYFLLTGQPPYPGRTPIQVLRAHVSAPPPVPSALQPRARYFDRVVTRAMSKAPVRRYRDADEMRAALAEAVVRMDRLGRAAPVAAAVDDTAEEPTRVDAAPVAVAVPKVGGEGDLAYLRGAPEPPPQRTRGGVLPAVGVVVAGLILAGGAAWMILHGHDRVPDAAAPPAPTGPASSAGPSASLPVSPSSAPPTSASTSPSASASVSAAQLSTSPSVTPTATSTVTEVSVPDLTGSLDGARSALRQAGLVVGRISRVPSPDPTDTVLGQTPGAGSWVRPGTAVDVTVASGRNQVPAVAGLTVDQAVSAIEAAGFTVDDGGLPADATVDGASPAAGTSQPVGSTITIEGTVPTSDSTPTESASP